MKFKIFNLLLFIVICGFLVSCEDGYAAVDQYVGDYVCEIKGQTLLILPSGKEAPTETVPTMIYPTDRKSVV